MHCRILLEIARETREIREKKMSKNFCVFRVFRGLKRTFMNNSGLSNYKNKNFGKNFWISLDTSGSRESKVKLFGVSHNIIVIKQSWKLPKFCVLRYRNPSPRSSSTERNPAW